MRAYSARHITRLASYRGAVVRDDELMEKIDFDQNFTNPQIFKLQIITDVPCKVLINGNSEVEIDPNYGLTIDYTDLMINSFKFIDNANVYVVVGY